MAVVFPRFHVLLHGPERLRLPRKPRHRHVVLRCVEHDNCKTHGERSRKLHALGHVERVEDRDAGGHGGQAVVVLAAVHGLRGALERVFQADLDERQQQHEHELLGLALERDEHRVVRRVDHQHRGLDAHGFEEPRVFLQTCSVCCAQREHHQNVHDCHEWQPAQRVRDGIGNFQYSARSSSELVWPTLAPTLIATTCVVVNAISGITAWICTKIAPQMSAEPAHVRAQYTEFDCQPSPGSWRGIDSNTSITISAGVEKRKSIRQTRVREAVLQYSSSAKSRSAEYFLR